MSYLKQICCPDHSDASLFVDYQYSNGDIVSNFLIFTSYLYTKYMI